GDRGGAGGLGSGGLALLGDHVGGVGLDGLALRGVGVGAAQREVGDEHDRVDAGLLGGAVELHDDVVLLAALLARGDVDGLGGGGGAVLDELVADLDRGGAEAGGLGGVDVADGAVAALDRRLHAGGAVAGLAAVDGPGLDRTVGPGVGRVLGEVLGEVLGGARVVGAVDGN